MRATVLLFLAIAACSSAPPDPAKFYVVLDNTPRAPKARDAVEFLEREPTDRPFKVIGLIAPPEGDYESFAQVLNAVRGIAASRGADAVFIISEETKEGWSFGGGSGGAYGGSTEETAVRAKAIVWQKP